ncbi:unnamed protein product [Angiostrongylus costaricensis]|uniref:Reverse transcriptase domain-containing protein n=1 Tax=Angiostrongylus costaricensis TaxID=334426 RepID=A0A0R3PPI1_ANGCS|nr:unnamed protein product [Angiostrongylus costaricensis]
MNMENNMKEEQDRRRRAAWAALGPLEDATDQLKDPKSCAHLFDSTVHPVLCYAAETWVNTSTTLGMLRTARRALERCLLKHERLREEGTIGICARVRIVGEDGPSKYPSK